MPPSFDPTTVVAVVAAASETVDGAVDPVVDESPWVFASPDVVDAEEAKEILQCGSAEIIRLGFPPHTWEDASSVGEDIFGKLRLFEYPELADATKVLRSGVISPSYWSAVRDILSVVCEYSNRMFVLHAGDKVSEDHVCSVASCVLMPCVCGMRAPQEKHTGFI